MQPWMIITISLCTTFGILTIWAFAAHRSEMRRYRRWVERYEHREQMHAHVEQAVFEHWWHRWQNRGEEAVRQQALVRLSQWFNQQPTEQLEAHVERLCGKVENDQP